MFQVKKMFLNLKVKNVFYFASPKMSYIFFTKYENVFFFFNFKPKTHARSLSSFLYSLQSPSEILSPLECIHNSQRVNQNVIVYVQFNTSQRNRVFSNSQISWLIEKNKNKIRCLERAQFYDHLKSHKTRNFGAALYACSMLSVMQPTTAFSCYLNPNPLRTEMYNKHWWWN